MKIVVVLTAKIYNRANKGLGLKEMVVGCSLEVVGLTGFPVKKLTDHLFESQKCGRNYEVAY